VDKKIMKKMRRSKAQLAVSHQLHETSGRSFEEAASFF
jgi:hypothetical protein